MNVYISLKMQRLCDEQLLIDKAKSLEIIDGYLNSSRSEAKEINLRAMHSTWACTQTLFSFFKTGSRGSRSRVKRGGVTSHALSVKHDQTCEAELTTDLSPLRSGHFERSGRTQMKVATPFELWPEVKSAQRSASAILNESVNATSLLYMYASKAAPSGFTARGQRRSDTSNWHSPMCLLSLLSLHLTHT